MHKEERRRTWNLPLGIGLFGATVLVGGALLATRQARRPASRVEVSEPIASRPLPSYPEGAPSAVPSPPVPEPPSAVDTTASEAASDAAPTSIGGGRPPTEREEEEEREPPAPAPAPTRVAPAPSPAPAPAAAVQAPTTAASPAPQAVADASVPPQAAIPDGGMWGPPDAEYLIDGGIYSVAVGDAVSSTDPNAPYIYPTSGAGAAAANSATTSTGGGVTTTKQTVAASLMIVVPDPPDRFWTDVKPFLKSGDALVANVTSDSSPLLSFADRVRTDAPLVTYIVSFATTGQLESAVGKGLPATLGVVGLSQSASLTDAALTSAATKVHASDKRMFLSLKFPTDGPSMAAVSKSVDVVELIVAGANGTEVADQAKVAATSLGAKVKIYVRLPSSMTSASAAPTAANSVVAALPNAGVSVPAITAANITDYRTK